MIDVLTREGSKPSAKQFEIDQRSSLWNDYRLRKRIKVTGFTPVEDVTVQVKENGITVWCNHAGHESGIFFIDDELRGRGELCNRCEAWSYDGEEWHE